ncbi:MAG: hypothetical protein PHU25_22120, partial [Deltaproteobacteria bacterium]|nr:hypothetical protein [Deltaproteobacteria bacterium]
MSALLVVAFATSAEARAVLFYKDHTDFSAWMETNGHEIWAGPASSTNPEDGTWIRIASNTPATGEVDINATNDSIMSRGPMTIPASLGAEVRLAFRYKGYNADAWWIYELCALETDETSYPDPADCNSFYESFDAVTYPGLPSGWRVQDGAGDQSSVNWETDESEYFYPTVFHDWDSTHNVVQFLLTPSFNAGAEAQSVFYYKDHTDYSAWMEAHGHEIWAGPASSTNPEDGTWLRVASNTPATGEVDINATNDSILSRGPISIPTSLGSEVRLAFRYKGYNADAWWLYELCALHAGGSGYPDPSSCDRLFENFDTVTYPGLPGGWLVRDGAGDQSSVNWVTGESEYFYPTVFHNWDSTHNVVQFLITPAFSSCPNECCADADCEAPAAECVGGVSRVYTGRCSAGACSYSHADTDCATLTMPTSDACDGDDITTYTGPAACEAGVCAFETTTTHCANGCTVDGAGMGSCLGAPTGCGAAIAAMYAAMGAPGNVWSWSTGNEGWGLGSQSTPSGKWTRKSTGRTDGNSAGFTTCGGYSNNADWRAQLTSSANLSACAACNVNVGFWARGETEAGYDKLYAQCSGNGGSQWLSAGETSGPKTAWTEQVWALPAGCMTSNFRMSFDFKSDAYVTAQGYDVDDVRLFVNSGPGAGEVETLSFGQASGWACHAGNTNEALKVHVFFTRHSGGASLERVVTADVEREDAVASACGNVAEHGWVLTYDPELMSWLGSEPYSVHAFATPPSACGGDDWELPKKGPNVLFVSNNASPQESEIEKHLNELGIYNVSVIKDTDISCGANLSGYDLFVLTEDAPNVSADGLAAIAATGKPILLVEGGSFNYAHEL